MKSQIATTKEQSRRLLRCGVSADTADMMITPHNTLSANPYKSLFRDRGHSPAWSLSALLSIMPDLEHCFSLWKFEEDDTYAADATIKGIRDCSLGYVTCRMVARGYCPDFTPKTEKSK